MNVKGILFILVVSLLLFGSAYAAKGVNDFTVDSNYENVHGGNYHSVYLNGQKDSGITIYKNVNDDLYDNENDDAYDNLIHDDGREYITPDADMKIDKNADNTANFTDYDHASHGVGEVINIDGESFVVVFWAKDTSNAGDADLMSLLTQFNKDNGASAAAF